MPFADIYACFMPLQVGSVHAVDNDADTRNSRIQYSISETDQPLQHPPLGHHGELPAAGGGSPVRASSLFAITSNGEIYTRNFPIDREKTPILSFTVIASDYGNPPLSAYANIIVRVEDVNDHSPLWVFPQSSNHLVVRVNMSRHATVGREVAHLKAVDADSGENGEIEYEIIKGNEQEYFALDRASGTLYLAKPLNVETKAAQDEGSINSNNDSTIIATASLDSIPPSFILALKATDKGKVPRSNTTILRVDVTRNERYRGSELPLERYGTNGRNMGKSQPRYGSIIGDRDMMIITAMIAAALVISLVLIAAIVFLRCQQPSRRRHSAENVTYENGGTAVLKKMEILGCLSGEGIMRTASADSAAEKTKHSPAFILGDGERNPNFEEHLNASHYGSSKGTLIHYFLLSLQGTQ